MEMKAIKCPSCGANVEYDGTSPILRCEYCGTEIAMDMDIPNEVHIVDEAEMKRLEMRQQRHEERHERREKHREERHERHERRHEERDERRLGRFI
jgi:DNA-directed RNA polymerase subunit RPC12/RpoP